MKRYPVRIGPVFGRKKTQAPQAVELTKDHPEREGAKNRPTPKRRAAEAANRRPIVPEDRKAAAKAERERMRERRNSERVAVLSGDERHLPPRDAGPHRRFVRDAVDSRFNFGELYLPIMGVFLIGMILPLVLRMSYDTRAMFSLWTSALLYLLIILLAIDSFLMWRKVRAGLRARFGQDVQLRGLFAYALSRSVMVRRWRKPPVQVARGQQPRP